MNPVNSTVHAQAPAAQLAPEAQKAPQAAPAQAALMPDVRPTLDVLPVNVATPKLAPRVGYQEMVAHLEPLIQAQLKEVQAVMLAQGIKPGDVNMIYAPDITGKEISVCLACGIIGHDYQPTMVRTQNPEIDMLTESVVVFLEVAARSGANFGLIAYDDEGVVVLREVKANAATSERARVTERFQQFRDRYGRNVLNDNQVAGGFRGGKVLDRNWINQEKLTWKPSDANRKVAGEPDDKLAIDTIGQLMAKAPGSGAVKVATLAKSQIPTASLKSAEAVAKSKGVKLSGIAVGADASEIQKKFLARTGCAANMHKLRENIGSGIRMALDSKAEGK